MVNIPQLFRCPSFSIIHVCNGVHFHPYLEEKLKSCYEGEIGGMSGSSPKTLSMSQHNTLYITIHLNTKGMLKVRNYFVNCGG